jgi:hypothetical protein
MKSRRQYYIDANGCVVGLRQYNIALFGPENRKGYSMGKQRNPRAPRITVRVGQKHIDSARKKSSSHCMTADAMIEQLPQYKSIAVDIQTIRLTDPVKGLRYTYLTPRDVQERILKWDQGYEVKPFEFKLRGAQVTTMFRGANRKQKPVHKLGRKRLHANKTEKRNGVIPDVIGGRPPPKFSHRREFGLRAISLGSVFNLPESAAKAE